MQTIEEGIEVNGSGVVPPGGPNRVDAPGRSRKRMWWLVAVIAVVVVVLAGVGTAVAIKFGTDSDVHREYVALDAGQVDALPVLRADAVVPGLLDYTNTDYPSTAGVAYTIDHDIAVYGKDQAEAVGRFTVKNEFGNPTTIIVVQNEADWSLVLTPSRSQAPQDGQSAPAQTAGWVRTDQLLQGQNLSTRVAVSKSDSTLTILDTDGKSVGSYTVTLSDKGVPTGTGYLRLRFTDATAKQTKQPVTTTSLHATDADNPYGGVGAGVVTLSAEKNDDGDPVTDAAILLPEDAAAAIAALPLGTLITIR